MSFVFEVNSLNASGMEICVGPRYRHRHALRLTGSVFVPVYV